MTHLDPDMEARFNHDLRNPDRIRFRRYSGPKVMESAAGFYIGTTENVDGDEQPYNRLSGYYTTREGAQAALDDKDYDC